MAATKADAGPATTRDRPRIVKIAAVCAALVLILLLRRPEMFFHPEFWAEDGRIFFVQADTEGARALVTPYSGYHHFLLRLIAAASAGLNARWIPFAYIGANLTTIILIAIALFSPRLDLPHAAACALAIGLLPHTGEVVGNLTNLQWLSAIGLVWILIADEPATTRQVITDSLLAAVIGLTGIFSVLFAPLFAVRAWRRKTRPSILVASIVVFTAAIQIWTLTQSPEDSQMGFPPLGAIAFFVGFRLPASLFLPMEYAKRLPGEVLQWLGVVSVGLLIAAAAWKGKRQNTRSLVVAAILSLMAATILRSYDHFAAFGSLADGDRYLFLPKLLTVWLLISGCGSRTVTGWATSAACGLALITTLVDWHYERLADHHWPEYARRIEAGESLRYIPVNPHGYTFDHPGRNRKSTP